MFSSLGWPEIVVIALVALFVFGPERLPNMAKEAAGGLKKAREVITGVRAQVDEPLILDQPLGPLAILIQRRDRPGIVRHRFGRVGIGQPEPVQ